MLCLEVFLQIISIVVVLIIPKVLPTGMQIAVTGAILIKPKHAIANADDMAKIRKKPRLKHQTSRLVEAVVYTYNANPAGSDRIGNHAGLQSLYVRGNGKAMFISSDRGIWTCKLSEVAVHPEYDFATYNTIALVELETETFSNAAPMLPICMPTYMYNTSNYLYAFGFTDENKLLEKVAYKVQYVERALCDEFYMRAGRGKGSYTPQVYECAFAENNHGNCEWENGMALASNVTGSWVLVGFGVQGPGCSAPARFIVVYSYLRWIESSSSVDDFDVEYPFKVKVRRADTIDSIEHLEGDINTANYLKRDRSKFNMTFREFLKQYTFLNKTTRINEEKLTQNVTLKKFYNKSINDTKYFKQDNIHSDEFGREDKTAINKDSMTSIEHFEDDINMTNYLKRDHIKFNMTFLEFLKQYKFLNKTSHAEEGKIIQNVTHTKVSSKSNNDTRFDTS